jgi:hypothetical protein
MRMTSGQRSRLGPRNPDADLWTGSAGPALFTAGYVAEGFLVPGVDPWRQSISFLGQGPWGWVQNINFVVSALLILAFARALYRVGRAGGPGRAPIRRLAVFQAIGGFGMLVAGFVRQTASYGAPGLTTPFGDLTVPGLAHIAGAVLIFAAAVASAGSESSGAAPWTSRAWSRASGAAAGGMVALLGAFLVAAADGGPAGLWQRAASMVAGGWMVALAMRIRGWRSLAQPIPTHPVHDVRFRTPDAHDR